MLVVMRVSCSPDKPVFQQADTFPTASLSTASLSSLGFGSIFGTFRCIPSTFVTLSRPSTRVAGSVQQVVSHK